jgi:hypothetical protein
VYKEQIGICAQQLSKLILLKQLCPVPVLNLKFSQGCIYLILHDRKGIWGKNMKKVKRKEEEKKKKRRKMEKIK